MGMFGSLGKSISKGYSAGNQGPLGQVGGVLNAFGSGMNNVFGGNPMQRPMGMPTMQPMGQPDDENDPFKQQQKKNMLMQMLMQQGGRF